MQSKDLKYQRKKENTKAKKDFENYVHSNNALTPFGEQLTPVGVLLTLFALHGANAQPFRPGNANTGGNPHNSTESFCPAVVNPPSSAAANSLTAANPSHSLTPYIPSQKSHQKIHPPKTPKKDKIPEIKEKTESPLIKACKEILLNIDRPHEERKPTDINRSWKDDSKKLLAGIQENPGLLSLDTKYQLVPIAVANRDVRFLTFLINAGHGPTKERPYSPSLFRAFMDKNVEIIKRLIDAGAILFQTDENHDELLRILIFDPTPELLLFLKRIGWDMNKKITNMNELHPFIFACIVGHHPTIEAFIQMGAYIHADRPLEEMALLGALISGHERYKGTGKERLKIVKLLQSEGLVKELDPNKKDPQGRTLLTLAREAGWNELIEYMVLMRGIKHIHEIDSLIESLRLTDDFFPTFWGSEGRKKVIAKLWKIVKDYPGLVPELLAADKNNVLLIHAIADNDTEALNILVKHGCKVNQKIFNDEPLYAAFNMASKQHNEEIKNILINAGATMIQTEKSNKFLYDAILDDDTEKLQFFVEKLGWKIKTYSQRSIPFIHAIFHGKLKSIEYLLDQGLDIFEGVSPEMLAAQSQLAIIHGYEENKIPINIALEIVETLQLKGLDLEEKNLQESTLLTPAAREAKRNELNKYLQSLYNDEHHQSTYWELFQNACWQLKGIFLILLSWACGSIYYFINYINSNGSGDSQNDKNNGIIPTSKTTLVDETKKVKEALSKEISQCQRKLKSLHDRLLTAEKNINQYNQKKDKLVQCAIPGSVLNKEISELEKEISNLKIEIKRLSGAESSDSLNAQLNEKLLEKSISELTQKLSDGKKQIEALPEVKLPDNIKDSLNGLSNNLVEITSSIEKNPDPDIIKNEMKKFKPAFTSISKEIDESLLTLNKSINTNSSILNDFNLSLVDLEKLNKELAETKKRHQQENAEKNAKKAKKEQLDEISQYQQKLKPLGDGLLLVKENVTRYNRNLTEKKYYLIENSIHNEDAEKIHKLQEAYSDKTIFSNYETQLNTLFDDLKKIKNSTEVNTEIQPLNIDKIKSKIGSLEQEIDDINKEIKSKSDSLKELERILKSSPNVSDNPKNSDTKTRIINNTPQKTTITENAGTRQNFTPSKKTDIQTDKKKVNENNSKLNPNAPVFALQVPKKTADIVIHHYGDGGTAPKETTPSTISPKSSSNNPYSFYQPIAPEKAKQTAKELLLQLSAQFSDLANRDFTDSTERNIHKLALSYYLVRILDALYEMCKETNDKKYNPLMQNFRDLRNSAVKCAISPEKNIKDHNEEEETNNFYDLCLTIKNNLNLICDINIKFNDINFENIYNFNIKIQKSVYCNLLNQKWDSYKKLQEHQKQQNQPDQKIHIEDINSLISDFNLINQILKVCDSTKYLLEDYPERAAAAKALLIKASQFWVDAFCVGGDINNVKNDPILNKLPYKDKLCTFFKDLRKSRNSMAHSSENFYDIDPIKIIQFKNRIGVGENRDTTIIKILENLQKELELSVSMLRNTIHS